MEVQVSQDMDMQTYSQETKKLKLSVKRGKTGRKKLRKLIINSNLVRITNNSISAVVKFIISEKSVSDKFIKIIGTIFSQKSQ